VAIVRAGLTSVQATGATAPAFTGSLGVAIRVRKSNFYVMPFALASNPQKGTDGSLVSAILQPGVMLLYGFSGGGK